MSSHVRDMCPCHACMSTLTPCLQVAMGSIWAMRFVCVIDVEARGPATKRCFTRPAAAARLPLDRWDRFLLVTCACGIEPALRARCGAAVWSIMGRQSVPSSGRGITRDRLACAAARLPLDRWDRFLLVTCACGIEPALRARCGAAVWSIMGRQSVS